MTTDIVTQLRKEWEYGNNAKGCDYEMFAQAADEIERLRYECREWFLVAREMRDVILGQGDTQAALDDYLRVRGRLEDPRDRVQEADGE